MADFLVTVDGHYINFAHTNGLVRYDFDHLDFSIIYNDITGRVRAFDKYMSIFDSKTSVFDGYFQIREFWVNDKIIDNTSTITTSNTDSRYYRPSSQPSGPGMNSLSPTSSTDRIYLVKRWVELVGNIYKIKIGVKSFNYPNRNLLTNEVYSNNNPLFPGITGYLYEPYELDFSKPELATYVANVKLKKLKRPNGTITDLSLSEIDLVENISFIFEHLFREEDFLEFITDNQLTFIFNKHFEIINCVFPNTVITEDEYYKNFTAEYFYLLRLRLLEFYYWAKGGGYFSVTKIKMLTRIFGLFNTETLRHINYDDKINILYALVEDNWWISGRWWPSPSEFKLTEEETIVKLVNSMAREVAPNLLNYSEINAFMDVLNSVPRYDANGTYSFFQVLYEGINDAVFFGDDGKGARGKFVKAVYLLWLESKYNPNSLTNQSIAVNYNYTSYNAHWRFDVPGAPETFDETAAPNLINYESEKFLLWYKDNLNFAYSGKKIVAMIETKKDFSEYLLDSFITTIIPFRLNSTVKYIPYGFYDIFQPVSIRNTDPNDTIIRIPVATDINNPCAVNNGNNTNSIPIFYLKYIDDLGDLSDFKASFGVILDVVLTFTGIGNIAKARHLSKASVLRRFLFGESVSLVEKQLLVRAIRGISFATWELVLGTASILYSISNSDCQDYADPCNPPLAGTPQYDAFQRCQAIQKWLLALEIITLSGDLLAKRFFRKASRDLDQRLPTDFFDNLDPVHLEDVPPGMDPDDARPFIREAGDVDGALEDFLATLDNIITDKLDNLNLSHERRIEFMNDFNNQPDALSDFVVNPGLIDDWKDVAHLISYRKNIRFLKAYNFVVKDPIHVVFRKHILEGEVILKPSGKAKVGGMHHMYGEGVLENSHARMIILDNSDPRGYLVVHVDLKLNGNYYKKGPEINLVPTYKENDMFPQKWTGQEVLENIALAYSNRQYTGTKNQYIGELADGKNVILCIGDGSNDTDFLTKIITAWPDSNF